MTPNEFVEYCKGLEKEWTGLPFGKGKLNEVIELAQNIETIDRPDTCYLETHYVISNFIERNEECVESLEKIHNELGRGGLWDLAQQLTTEFEKTYEGVEWGLELDWNDTLEEFLNKKVK
jgi:hypothetical protein